MKKEIKIAVFADDIYSIKEIKDFVGALVDFYEVAREPDSE